MRLKAGARLVSTVDSTEVIVIRAPSAAMEVACGGHPMVVAGAEVPVGLQMDPAHAVGTALGKRFADEASGLEVLCTKGGDGSLSLDGAPLKPKEAKPLPASD